MNPTHRLFVAATLVATTLALGACFGGDDDDDAAVAGSTPSSDVPDSAGSSAGAFVAYLLGLAGSDETSEPGLINGGFAVPPDETSDPQPLI